LPVNKCDPRPVYQCVSTEANDCRYWEGKSRPGACVFMRDQGGMICCANRSARLSALIREKVKVMKP
jgi:hypothetical protein